MKSLISALLGTTALALMALGAATPAQARGGVGVYIAPDGFGFSVEQYRSYCRDLWYRHRYWRYCHRYYDDDDYGYGGYYQNYNNYYDDNDDWRWRRHRHHDRDDWGGEGERHHDRDDHHHHDGGEGDRDRDHHW